jgi:hypothetical protein
MTINEHLYVGFVVRQNSRGYRSTGTGYQQKMVWRVCLNDHLPRTLTDQLVMD